ncbi:MAG: M1 family aminopeptidase [Gemmatimonadota bacterium]|nr:M1 family aminopeptidase [Gemmatimonadota bacterium]
MRFCSLRSLLVAAVIAASTATVACSRVDEPITTAGVSLELARARVAQLDDVRYDVSLTIPASRDEPVTGTARIAFRLRDAKSPVVLDFVNPRTRVQAVRVGGVPVAVRTTDDHLVMATSDLRPGANAIALDFTAGDESLNRNPEFLYTLFVPDRARFAFPLFDQPDVKARYTLTLRVPIGWTAVANGATVATDTAAGAVTFRFAETEPISSYLFAFAAGRFQIEEAERDGRRYRLFHRETDGTKVTRNRDAIFDLHHAALTWLEEYTGIPYPFGKFDFVAVPAFQYNGMEHPGAVYYRASTLFLEPTATQAELLGRASVIAHETAHMWFGDLVTMRWFDDVWMKEVFANFMAAKIVNPSFPAINHELRFLLAHYPAAYAVDRTAGANPIRQELDNLREAGTLYGAIIYQKAPIVMRHLERRVGDSTFRDGLRAYLERFRFGNASWPDLIALLDARTPDDLAAWSRAWIEQPGRPTVRTGLAIADDGTIAALGFQQQDPAGTGREWPQRLDVLVAGRDSVRRLDVPLDSASTLVPEASGWPAPRLVLPNGTGVAYGDVVLDPATLAWLVDRLADLPDEVARGAAWLALWDAMLDGRLEPETLLATGRRALARESAELTQQRMLADLTTLFWRYLPDERRTALSPGLEREWWRGVGRAARPSLKAAWLRAYGAMANTAAASRRLEALWSGALTIPGLPLAERDFIGLAQALAVRRPDRAPDILTRQLARITNPDRRAEFAFVMPALSPDTAVRDSVFASLADARNREHEPWVLDAMAWLNHPLRRAHAVRYVRPSLELLEEIQRTGDIFFPLNWLHATLDGHNSTEAAATVRAFLDERPEYPPRLRAKILQAADALFRAERRRDDGRTG